MKLKTLQKKIQRLETRLREGPEKLARLQRKLAAMEKANAAAARGALVSIVRRTEKTPAPPRISRRSPVAKVSAKATRAKKASPPTKAKRKLNLSPERRAELSAAMTARWAAKRAAANVPEV
ncbi:MAG: hypothetical protein ABI992_10175 [Chthoniobacterales bacterium]